MNTAMEFYEECYNRIKAQVVLIAKRFRARAAFLLDGNCQQLATTGIVDDNDYWVVVENSQFLQQAFDKGHFIIEIDKMGNFLFKPVNERMVLVLVFDDPIKFKHSSLEPYIINLNQIFDEIEELIALEKDHSL